MEIATTDPAGSEVSSSNWRDWLGIVASIGCAVHCATMPFVFAYLPTWGLSFLADESFHKWMALACFLIAIAAFIPGIRKHKSWIPVSIGAIGLALITFAAFGLEGKCCPECDSISSKQQRQVTVAAAGAFSGCKQCEECTSHSVVHQGVTNSESSENTDEESLLAILAPWITPIGGLTLVSAHLMNRRYGCLCGCC